MLDNYLSLGQTGKINYFHVTFIFYNFFLWYWTLHIVSVTTQWNEVILGMLISRLIHFVVVVVKDQIRLKSLHMNTYKISMDKPITSTDLTYIKCYNIYTLEFKFKWVFQNGILKANTRFPFFIKQVWPTMVLWSVEEQQ